MRKTINGSVHASVSSEETQWLDLETIAQVEVTSEDPDYPIEAALTLADSVGWRAGQPGEQIIRLLFDEPQSLRHIRLLFLETAVERMQEFLLSWSPRQGQPLRDIVRQQYHFSPGGSTRELENYHVELEGVRMLELRITPDRNGGSAPVSLALLRVG